jgi:molybdopterin-guanine dinucleotide biosynthesis protein A
MPFTSARLIEAASRIMFDEEADVVIPRAISETEPVGKSEGFEPLHAVYRRATCLPAIEAAIDSDQWKVIAWFPQVKVRVLTVAELQSLDPDGLAFWNVNTPEEFAKAEGLATSRPAPGTAPH